jgi:hypothetical protein
LLGLRYQDYLWKVKTSAVRHKSPNIQYARIKKQIQPLQAGM